MQLTKGQQWALAAFVTTIITMANGFFLEGQVQTFAYIVISVCFAAFAVLMSSGKKQKNEADA